MSTTPTKFGNFSVENAVEILWALSHEGSDEAGKARLQRDVWAALYNAGFLPHAGLGVRATATDIRAVAAKGLEALDAEDTSPEYPDCED